MPLDKARGLLTGHPRLTGRAEVCDLGRGWAVIPRSHPARSKPEKELCVLTRYDRHLVVHHYRRRATLDLTAIAHVHVLRAV